MGLLDYILPKKLEKGLTPNWEVSEGEGGEVRVRNIPQPVKRAIYSSDDPSPVARIASRFLVEMLPASATREEHAAWFLFSRVNAMTMVNSMKALTDVQSSDFTILSDVNKLAQQVEQKSSLWEQFVGAASVPPTVALRATARQLRSLVLYAFEVADAGWGAHMGTVPDRLIADGTLTAEEMEADYMRRLAIYQAVFQLLTNEETRFLMTGEEPSLSGAQALGLTGAEIAAVIIGILAIVFVCACAYSAYQTYAVNAVFERQSEKCLKAFIATGQESEACKAVPKEWGKNVTKNPANVLSEDLVFYLTVAGGIFVGVMFLPEIMASIRMARSEARAAQRQKQMASNRRRRLRA